jgi:uncharacterized protein YpmS
MFSAVRTQSWLLVLALLGLSVLACSLGSTPTPPASPIPVSTEAAGQVEDLWQSAIENAQNGEVTVVMTEEQLTSYVAVRLAEQPDPPFDDVQVFLRDGKMTLFGNATLRGITAPAQVVLSVSTTAEGRLQVSIDEADFGPVPVPQSMLETLSDGLNEMMSGDLGPQATGVRITSVAIADGQMSLTGTVVR